MHPRAKGSWRYLALHNDQEGKKVLLGKAVNGGTRTREGQAADLGLGSTLGRVPVHPSLGWPNMCSWE